MISRIVDKLGAARHRFVGAVLMARQFVNKFFPPRGRTATLQQLTWLNSSLARYQ